jgi:hypothetical protein
MITETKFYNVICFIIACCVLFYVALPQSTTTSELAYSTGGCCYTVVTPLPTSCSFLAQTPLCTGTVNLYLYGALANPGVNGTGTAPGSPCAYVPNTYCDTWAGLTTTNCTGA